MPYTIYYAVCPKYNAWLSMFLMYTLCEMVYTIAVPPIRQDTGHGNIGGPGEPGHGRKVTTWST